jgi:hypothetical protein
MYLQKVISKKLERKIIFVAILKVTDENSRIRSRIRLGSIVRGYADQDPYGYKNVTDPQNCC